VTRETTARPLRVLLVEDSPADAELVLAQLRRGGYAPAARRVETEASLRDALAGATWDCVLSDYELPQFSGLHALRIVQESGRDLPFIVISGAIGEDMAVSVMKAGAHDYVMKESLARLCPVIERELREAAARQAQRRNAAARAEDDAVAAALHRVGRTLIAALDTPALLGTLCEVAAGVLQCDSSHTLLWQPDARVFRPIANYGATPEEQALARATAVPLAMMQRLLRRFEHDDVAQITPTAVDLLSTPQQRASTQLCIALRRGTELIGIQVASRRDSQEPFGRVACRIGRGVAQMASLVLEHARVRRELEQSNRLKSDFVATMSHELRTPLNIILGYTDLLRDGEFGPLAGEQREVLRRIELSARSLLEMVNATLDLSRLERGLAPLDIEPVALGEWLQELAHSAVGPNVTRGVPLRLHLSSGLPTLHTDPVKLKVIVSNLLTNAFKFTSHGAVTLSARPHPDGVEIAVADTGQGIAPDVLPIIFEPFRQGGDVNTGHVPGVGLGLYIVRKLLDLLHGSIGVESEVGKGSTFRIRLPRELPHARPLDEPERAARG
jgi:signal transduction histidine kinase/FixJ family two-component response regulator